MAEETTPNTHNSAQSQSVEQAPAGETAGEESPPSTVDQQAPSVVSENLRSTAEPETTSIPTANAPDPTTANPEVNPDAAAEKDSQAVSTPDESASQPKAATAPKGDKPAAKAAKPAAAKAAGDKPPAKAAKKEKGPAVEDKPFKEFIEQDYLPALKSALSAQGVKDLELTFEKQKFSVPGYSQTDACWQIMGRWQNGGQRQFNLYFPQEDIQGQRAFSCNEGPYPSTLEPFLIDERKVNLDLMVYGVVQRLNGQKWLVRN